MILSLILVRLIIVPVNKQLLNHTLYNDHLIHLYLTVCFIAYCSISMNNYVIFVCRHVFIYRCVAFISLFIYGIYKVNTQCIFNGHRLNTQSKTFKMLKNLNLMFMSILN